MGGRSPLCFGCSTVERRSQLRVPSQLAYALRLPFYRRTPLLQAYVSAPKKVTAQLAQMPRTYKLAIVTQKRCLDE